MSFSRYRAWWPFRKLFCKLPHKPGGSDRYFVSCMWNHDRPGLRSWEKVQEKNWPSLNKQLCLHKLNIIFVLIHICIYNHLYVFYVHCVSCCITVDKVFLPTSSYTNEHIGGLRSSSTSTFRRDQTTVKCTSSRATGLD